MNRLRIFFEMVKRAWILSGQIALGSIKEAPVKKDDHEVKEGEVLLPGEMSIRKRGQIKRQSSLPPVEVMGGNPSFDHLRKIAVEMPDDFMKMSCAEAANAPPAPMPDDWNCTNCSGSNFGPHMDDRYPNIPRMHLMKCRYCGRLYVIDPNKKKERKSANLL